MSDLINKSEYDSFAAYVDALEDRIAELESPALPDEVQTVIDRLTDPKKSAVLRDYTAADLIKRLKLENIVLKKQIKAQEDYLDSLYWEAGYYE